MATRFNDTYEFPDEKLEKAAAEDKFEIEIEDDTPTGRSWPKAHERASGRSDRRRIGHL